MPRAERFYTFTSWENPRRYKTEKVLYSQSMRTGKVTKVAKMIEKGPRKGQYSFIQRPSLRIKRK